MGINKGSIVPFLKKNIFTTEVFVKIMAGMTLLFFYTLVSSCFLPKGINYVFVTALCPRVLISTLILYLAFSICFYHNKKRCFKYENFIEGFDIKDLCLLFLPMTPIARYIILNQDALSAFDSIIVFAIFLSVSFVLTFLIPVILSMVGSKKILIVLGLSFSYVLFNMASLASDFCWHLSGNLKVQLSILAVVFGISLVIYSLDKKFLNVGVVAFFFLNTLASLISSEGVKNHIRGFIVPIDNPKICLYTKDKQPKTRPDIFLLTYDAYVENETMLKYGINNNAQEDYLIQNGFHIYKGTYSVGSGTTLSMSRVLNIHTMLYIIEPSSWLSPFISDKCISYPRTRLRSVMSGDGAVQNILKQNGYETFGIFFSDYFLQNVPPSYDHVSPMQQAMSYKLFTKAIFEGEFRFDTYKMNSEFLYKKRDVLASNTKRPKFLYAHSEFPNHSQNSGKALGNEIEVFKRCLAKANEEMRGDIETIKRQKPDAIIIINGDHGPYLTKNCTCTADKYDKSEIDQLDIQDRIGAFLAIKWPEGANIDHDKIKILQDIFPAVFAYLYDDDSIFNSRIEQLTLDSYSISGVRVRNGVIEGGKDDGKPLFDSMKKK